MRSREYNKIYFIAAIGLCLSACSSPLDSGNVRLYDVPKVNREQAHASVFSADRIWPEVPATSACERLEALANERSHRRSRFSFLAAPFTYAVGPDGNVRALGSSNLMNSPLVQFVLTQAGVERRVQEILGMEDAVFLNLARERLDVEFCEKEEPRSERCTENLNQWRGALAKFQDGLLYQEKPTAVARELRAKFAGIFGGVDEMRLGKDNSVLLNVLDRVGLFHSRANPVSRVNSEAILSAEVPLFPYSRSWQDWRNDVTATIPAAIGGIAQTENMADRLCSLVLWQRMFAQLLLIKGYESPNLTREGHLPALPTDAIAIPKFNVPGAYFEPKGRTRVMLKPEEIPHYDPARANNINLLVNAVTPQPRDRTEPEAASLSDVLDQFEAYVWIFAATSPAAPWTNHTRYFLGDLVESPQAIIPFQTHTLALGLAVMTLRNLAQYNLIPVDFQNDRWIAEGNGTALALLANGKEQLEQGEQRLYDLARFTLALVRLDESIRRIQALAQENMASLESRSIVYDKEENREEPFYTLEKVRDLEALLQVLNRLKYPLAHRLAKLGDRQETCVESEVRNFRFGTALPTAQVPCSPATFALYQEAMEALAHSTRSSVILRRTKADE